MLLRCYPTRVRSASGARVQDPGPALSCALIARNYASLLPASPIAVQLRCLQQHDHAAPCKVTRGSVQVCLSNVCWHLPAVTPGHVCSADAECRIGVSTGQVSATLLPRQACADPWQVVDELLKYLVVADYSMREEIVLKTAVLAERFFPSLEWYVDSMLTLIERAGEFASKDVWCARSLTPVPPLPVLLGAASRGCAIVPTACRGACCQSCIPIPGSAVL